MKMKRIASVLLMLVLCCVVLVSTAFAADDVLVVDWEVINDGTQIKATVSIPDDASVVAAATKLTYNSEKLTVNTINCPGLANDNGSSIACSFSTPMATDLDVLCTVTFDIKDNAVIKSSDYGVDTTFRSYYALSATNRIMGVESNALSCSHYYGDWKTDKYPNCSEDGLDIRSCTVCGHDDERVTDATGMHRYTEDVVDAKYLKDEATCETAATYYKSCAGCGIASTTATFTDGEKDPANHTALKAEAEKPATCTATGTKAYWHCDGCDLYYADAEATTPISQPETIEKLAHTGGTATCASPAKCTVCGNTYGEKDAANHVGDEILVDDKAATCTEEGYTGDKVCSSCKVVLEKGQSIDKIAHAGGTATCVSGAICDTCGQAYGEKNPANHADKKLDGAKDATCTEDGSTGTGKCGACGVELDAAEVIPALGHIGGEANCSEKAVCDRCGETYGELNPNKHENWFAEEAVKASCSTEGMKAYWCCEDCGKYYTDKEMTQEIAEADLVIAKDPAYHANGDLCFHEAFEGTCSLSGNIAYLHCESCDIYWTVPEGFDTNELGEDFDFSTLTVLGTGAEAEAKTVTEGNKDYHTCYKYDANGHWTTCGETAGEVEEHKMNTETTGGKKTSVCAVCNYTVIEKISGGSGAESPKTDGESPKTGDEANIALWAVMFVMAGAGAVVLSLKKKEN